MVGEPSRPRTKLDCSDEKKCASGSFFISGDLIIRDALNSFSRLQQFYLPISLSTR